VFEASKPALYFSKAQCVDEMLMEIKGNRYPKNALSFGTTLLQNNVTGCTLVFNRALLQLLRQGIPKTVLMHDHWIYLVCKAFEGNVVYDPNSHILYRQHSNNVIGSNSNPLDRFKKSGFFDNNRIRSKIAFELISIYGSSMPKEQKITTNIMVNYRSSLKNKWNLIRNPEIKTHRQGTDILLIFNILFNKV
jgi:rhamnosyltransferase